MNDRAVGYNFERDPPKNHPCQAWFNLVQWFQRRRFKCESLQHMTHWWTAEAKWCQKLTWPRELIITWCVYESQSIIRRVISVSALALYIRYIYFWNLKFLNNFIIIMIDWFIVFNATFSNISAIPWRPVLVVEEAGVPGENHRPWASNW